MEKVARFYATTLEIEPRGPGTTWRAAASTRRP